MLKIKTFKKYGRGLVASENIKAGTVIEVSPILLLDKQDTQMSMDMIIWRYSYLWTKTTTALALGLGSLFNHNEQPNVDYQINKKDKTIEYVTLKNVSKGEQLFINYGYDPTYYMKKKK